MDLLTLFMVAAAAHVATPASAGLVPRTTGPAAVGQQITTLLGGLLSDILSQDASGPASGPSLESRLRRRLESSNFELSESTMQVRG
eukprot:COSAG06_NODE_14888_length_1117_cov_1.028487_2_plen_87_part_00